MAEHRHSQLAESGIKFAEYPTHKTPLAVERDDCATTHGTHVLVADTGSGQDVILSYDGPTISRVDMLEEGVNLPEDRKRNS